MSMRSSWVW